MSNCSASWASVFSPLMAASATFALKAGVWFRRARLLIVSPDSRVNLARRQAETPLIALFRFLRPALPEILPRRPDGRGGASVVRYRRRFNRTEDLDVNVSKEALSSAIRSGWCSKGPATGHGRPPGQEGR